MLGLLRSRGVLGLQPPPALPQVPRSHPAMEAATTLLDAEAVGDLVLLDPLTEESLLRTLQERFRRSDIYVGIGTGPRGWVVGQGAAGGCAGVGGERRDPSWVLPAVCAHAPSHLPADVHRGCGDLGQPLPAPAHLHP